MFCSIYIWYITRKNERELNTEVSRNRFYSIKRPYLCSFINKYIIKRVQTRHITRYIGNLRTADVSLAGSQIGNHYIPELKYFLSEHFHGRSFWGSLNSVRNNYCSFWYLENDLGVWWWSIEQLRNSFAICTASYVCQGGQDILV